MGALPEADDSLRSVIHGARIDDFFCPQLSFVVLRTTSTTEPLGVLHMGFQPSACASAAPQLQPVDSVCRAGMDAAPAMLTSWVTVSGKSSANRRALISYP
ncbi:hypothetical protein CB1_001331012 [Camelus ferus]|nr:hypothetical protein CB1_001331012 [Camelus ferus]